ncbi:MAG: glycosyltransferase [Deltaproteobacteria bacterium]|nr:glycosyltransferase [Deltaproteobacteria bacterium]
MADDQDRFGEHASSADSSPLPRGADASARALGDWARSNLLPLLEGVHPSLPILELGCGPGDLLACLSNAGFAHVSGIEASSEQTALAHARGLAVQRGDALEQLEGPGSRFGAILAMGLLEQLGRDQHLTLLTAIHDRLLPGGVLVVKTSNGRSFAPTRWLVGKRSRNSAFTPESLEQVLRLAGFEDVVARDDAPVADSLTNTLRRRVEGSARALHYLGTGRSQTVWSERMLCRSRKPGVLPGPDSTAATPVRAMTFARPSAPAPREETPRPSGERARVLIIGQALADMMMESYQRALSPYYDVKVVDPFSVLANLEKKLFGTHFGAQVNRVAATVSRVALGSEIAPAEARILRAAEEFDPDLILTDSVEVLRPKLVEALRKTCPHAKLIGQFGDAISNFGRGYVFIADYDRLFFKDRYIVDKLRAKLRSTTAFYLPQSCDRSLHRRVELTDADRHRYGCDIALYGNAYLYRAATLTPLLGRDVKVWGGGLPRWANHRTASMFTGHYIAGEEKCRAMLAAKIALNPNHYAEIQGTNKRTFELAAVGAFQLTDTPALADVFDSATEVAQYDTVEDLLDKIDFYLAHPELRTAMAERAHVRAHSSHTYEHRWVAMLETLDLRPPADFPVQPTDVKIWAS